MTILAASIVDGPEASDAVRDRVALSATGVKRLLPPSTPAHYRWAKDHPSEPTDEMMLGIVVHTLVFGVGRQPELAPARWQSDKDKAAVAAIRERGLIPLRPDDWDRAHRMAEAVLTHPDAGMLLDSEAGIPERGIFWRDEATGVECKALIDWSFRSRLGLLYLKTGASAAPEDQPRTIGKFGYQLQAKHELEGAEALRLVSEGADFILVFVESKPPHFVSVSRLDWRDLDRAGELCLRAREIYRDCMESGIWPGYPTGINTISLPEWVWRQYEEESW